VAWSADDKFLATGGGDRNVRIWDPASGSEVMTLKGHEGTVLALAWDPELNRLASGGADEEGKVDKTILIWDLASGIATPLEGHLDRVLSLAFSPDGNSLASGSADRTTILWDARSLSPINSLTDHSHWVTGVDFSATRPPTLATGSFDRSVILYDIITQRPLNSELAQNIGSIQSLYFGEETVVEAIDSRGNLATLDVETSDQEKRPLTSIVGAPVSAAFSPDGTKLVLGYEDGEIKVLDAQTGSQLLPSMNSEAGEVLSMAFSPDNQTLAASVCSEADAELDICVKNDIQLWDLTTGTLQDTHTSSHTDLITSLAFSPDGGTLASGSKDRSIILWDLATQTALGAPLTKHDNTVASLTFSQDGTMLASGDQDGELILWDRQSYQPIGETFPVSSDALDALAFSPSGNSLAFSSANGNIVLLDLSPTSWITRACALAGRNMSQAEWEQFIPGSDYRLTCSEFPQGE
jgi:WD40 repeat protein